MREAGVAMDWPDILGTLGALLIVAAYFGNVRGLFAANSALYPLLNLAGALLIIYSLLYKWNFSAFVMEGFWAVISIYGLVRFFRQPRPR
jgi:hypothetical protein